MQPSPSRDARGPERERSRAHLQQPRVLAQVRKRLENAVADRELGRPAQRSHLLAVKQDERVVSDPAAIATRVLASRLDTERFADPANRVVDLAILVGTEIEDVDLARRTLRRHENRVDAVLYVEIRLALLAVTEDAQARRVLPQAVVEVEDVAVRVALAENRHESKDPPLHPEALAKRL